MTISLVDKVAGTTPAGGGGAVSSVNSRTGDVVLTAADVGATLLTGSNTGDETPTSIGALIAGASAKTTPVATDIFGFSDSQASNVLKECTLTNLRDALYQLGMPKSIVVSGVPFVMFGGNGSSTGLQFSGSAGSFTLSAAIMTSSFNLLAGGGYAYFPANFGGQTIAAGWYYCTMSDDTHGILYQNTYSSGQPTIPASPTAFVANLTGWLTQTTSEVTALSGFTLTGNSLGKNGLLTILIRMIANNSAGSKYGRIKISTIVILSNSLSTSYLDTDMMHAAQAMGSAGKLLCTRNGAPGFGGNYTSYSADVVTVDTTVDQAITGTMQLATNTDSLIVVFRSITAQYGA